MKTLLTDLLICPACLPKEKGLTVSIQEKNGEDIITATLNCHECGIKYPVREGIASLIPGFHPGNQQALSKYESSALVSSYLWSHYAETFEDRDASTAYGEWAGLLTPGSGFSLDAGCAVGRFTFEMSKKSDFAVGIDKSHAFIRKARDLMIHGQLEFSMPEEGLLMEDRTISLSETGCSKKVEFLVGDVQCLPFRSGLFASVSSLNLVDKVPLPLVHLKEVNRVARESHAQLLFSDPFSWSSDISREEDWLGGTTDGPYPGKGIDNILSLLTGEIGELLPPWKVKKQGHIWWKIRNHKNHFELIRSCFIKALR